MDARRPIASPRALLRSRHPLTGCRGLARIEGARMKPEIPAAQTEPAFVDQRQRDWDHLDSVVRAAQTRDLRRMTGEQISGLSPLYRDVCADLSRARAARYGRPLLEYLEGLAAAAHA